jgi:hypothetical protein
VKETPSTGVCPNPKKVKQYGKNYWLFGDFILK